MTFYGLWIYNIMDEYILSVLAAKYDCVTVKNQQCMLQFLKNYIFLHCIIGFYNILENNYFSLGIKKISAVWFELKSLNIVYL